MIFGSIRVVSVSSRRAVLVVALVLGAGLLHADPPPEARGAELIAPFKRQLMQALQEGLARGPVEAISACRVKAPEIVESLSGDGVRMGRSSHRLRNPANAPEPWVAAVLEAYLADPSRREPRRVERPDGRRGYVEPILLQPLCLGCHGESLAPEVSARIHELYPEDRAVGFQTGDLRGVFWVEYPAGASGPPDPPRTLR